MAQHAQPATQRRPGVAHRVAAVGDLAGGGRQQRRQDREQRGLAGAVRPEQADDLAGVAVEGNLGEGPATAKVPADVCGGQACEVDAHAPTGSSIQLAHHALELRDQRFAPGRIAVVVDSTLAALLLERQEVGVQLLAALLQLRFALRRLPGEAQVQPDDEHDDPEADADVAHDGAVVRQAAQVQRQGVAGVDAAAGGHEKRRAARIGLLLLRELRRRNLQIADFLGSDEELLDRGRQRLRQRHAVAAIRDAEAHLHLRRPGRERPVDPQPIALQRRQRRRTLHRARAGGHLRQIDHQRPAGIDRRPRAVDDVEQIEDLEVIVLELDDDARLAAEYDDALARGLPGAFFGCGLLARRRRGNPRDERDPHATLGRHWKRL